MLVLVSSEVSPAQGSRAKTRKGPRAIGLLEFAPGGKAHLIPVAIRIDGEFYDASAYKASPVPMALWSEVVYEAFRTGVSQGLFTVTAALQNQQTNEWIAEGAWQSAAELAAKAEKKRAPAEPRGLNDDEGPPVLRHSGSGKPKAPEAASAKTPAEPPAPATPATPPAPVAAAPAPSPASAPEPADNPVLKRGKPAPKPEEPVNQPPAGSSNPPAHPAAVTKPQMQMIPAISDANSTDSRSYTYDLKPEEQERLRKKMLALAGDEIRAKAKQLEPHAGGPGAPTHVSKRPGKTDATQPKFDDVQLRVFDLSGNNEPLLVLTASAQMPHIQNENSSASDSQYMVTLIAREDVNGDFHKALANVTDTRHLDVLPRLELIDAVDADGDGRGELLFRQVSDTGSAFAIYRVIGDQLYPLFQGKLP